MLVECQGVHHLAHNSHVSDERVVGNGADALPARCEYPSCLLSCVFSSFLCLLLSHHMKLFQKLFNVIQKPCVSYETIVYTLVASKSPMDQVAKYLAKWEDVDEKRSLAVKLKLTDVVIEV